MGAPQAAPPSRRRRAELVAALLAVLVFPLALVVRLRWGPLDRADAHVDTSVHGWVLDHTWVLDSAKALTHLGDPWVVTVLTGVLAVALLIRRRARAALYVVVVRLAAVVVSSVVKLLVDRARPVLADPVAHAQGHSFPSGHALGSAAFWGTCGVLLAGRVRPGIAVAVGVVVPVVVAATRVLLGVHFVSDVVAGLLLGWAVALGPAVLLREGQA